MSDIVIDDTVPYTQSIATNLQTVFDTDWTVDATTDVLVYARADGTTGDDVTDLISSADYTVSLQGASETVRVTFDTGRTTSDIVTLTRLTPADRENLYTNANFTPTMLNGDFGLYTFILQQNQMYSLQRQLLYNNSSTVQPIIDTMIPVLAAGEIWRKNTAGTAMEAIAAPETGIAGSAYTYLTLTDMTANLPNSTDLSALADGIMVNDSGDSIKAVTITGTTSEIDVSNGTGISGAPTIGISDNPLIPGTEGMGIPEGTTAQRVAPSTGIGMRYNTDLSAIEYYDGATWISLDDADLSIYLLLAGGAMTGAIAMGTNKITGMGDPTSAQDAATKIYADLMLPLLGGAMTGDITLFGDATAALNPITLQQYLAGITNVHPACSFAETADLNTYTYDNGTAGVGATMTAGGNGAATVDGGTTVLNDRILMINQSSNLPWQGVYYVSQVGTAGLPVIYTRALDMDEASEFDAGDIVSVVGGAVYPASRFMMTQTAAITVGTTDITFAEQAVTGALLAANDLSDVTSASTSRTNLGLDTMATQAATAVAITGGAIDGTTIGATTAAAGYFTMLDSNVTATENDTAGVTVECDAAGFTDIKGIELNYVTGAQPANSNETGILMNIDDTLSVGGAIFGFQVLTTAGAASVTALRAAAQVNPLEHLVGTFTNADSILNIAVDVTAALANGGAGAITAFAADNDTMTIGESGKFEEIEWILTTPASGSGIAPTFEYSDGIGSWVSFTPTDGTNGLRQTGIMIWDDADVPTWAVGTGSEYLIRITRTRNSLATSPVIDELQIAIDAQYGWDKDAAITAVSLATTNIALTGQDIQHVGDTDNKITFGTDTQSLETGGTSRLDLSDSGVRLGAANSRVTTILDEDNLVTDSDTALATQQSIKAYVDAVASASMTFTNKTIDANGTGNSISNIDVADLADGTDGQLITWGADAKPTVVATGTSGHILTSAGAGAPPAFAAAAAAGGAWTYISGATASASATIDFTAGIDGTYDSYVLIFSSCVPATDNVDLFIRTSTDAGAAWDSGASDYAWSTISNNSGSAVASDTADSKINTTYIAGNGFGNASTESGNVIVRLFNPSSASLYTTMTIDCQYLTSAAFPQWATTTGHRISAGNVDGIRFYMSSGNIASGTCRLYGISNS